MSGSKQAGPSGEAEISTAAASLHRHGFTLIELLTVIAILGILAAILFPSVGAARSAAHRARTRIQFAAWAAAFEAFRQEYGHYPILPGAGAAVLVNAGAGPDPAQPHWFYDALSGRRRDGSALPESTTTNPHHARFITFGEEDLVNAANVANGGNRADELSLVRDAFHNTQIAVAIDANLDGVINLADFGPAGTPAVEARTGQSGLRPSEFSLSGPGVRAGVVFYSARPGASADADLITSWR